MSDDVKRVLELIEEGDVKYVDLRFTDPRGKVLHVRQHVRTIDEDSLVEGFMFDGSSIAGWKAINESDMDLQPDLTTAVMDPFFAQHNLAITCDIVDPSTGHPYARAPRSPSTAPLTYIHILVTGDTATFGPQ